MGFLDGLGGLFGGMGGAGAAGAGAAGAGAAAGTAGVSMGLSLIPSAVGLVSGLLQTAHAKKLAAANQFPTQTVGSEYYQNQALAQRAAQSGMPAQQYNNQMNQINQGQANGMAGLQGRGSAVGGIGALTARTDQAGANLNAQDATMRMNNLKGLMQANATIGQQKQSAFDWNQKQQYSNNAAAARNYQGAGMQNMMNSAQDLGKLGVLGQLGYWGGNVNSQGLTPKVNTNSASVNNNLMGYGLGQAPQLNFSS